MTNLFCKDCKHYNYRPHHPSASDALFEHECRAVLSMVTGEPQVRDAVTMRDGGYAYHNCGVSGSMFEKHEPVTSYMENPTEGYMHKRGF